MTSAKTETPIAPTQAQIHLEYAIGKRRVHLSELSRDEFGAFLNQCLEKTTLAGLRGFKPLKEILASRGDTWVEVANSVIVAGEAHDTLTDAGFITPQTQSAKVCRGVCSQVPTYRRMESDEETSDWRMVNKWGRDAYLYSSKERLLVLARPHKHAVASQNLFVVDYEYRKVPHEKRYIVHSIEATRIAAEKFLDFFGTDGYYLGQGLIWELRSLHSQTYDALKYQAENMREHLKEWERFANSV